MPGKRNDESITNLNGEFQYRYEPNFAWVNAISAFSMLPGLRAFWPMSSVHFWTGARGWDATGMGNYLLDSNTVLFGYDALAPYAEFDGAAQALYRTDAGAGDWADITGSEAYIESTRRGITMGGWFYLTRLTNLEGLITKRTGVAANNQYGLFFQGNVANDPLYFEVTNAALNALTVQHIFTPSANNWYFCVGRYDISSETVSAWVNKDYTTAQNIGQGAIQDTGTEINIGATVRTSDWLQGKASLCFLSAVSLPDFTIRSIFEQTRALFGA